MLIGYMRVSTGSRTSIFNAMRLVGLGASGSTTTSVRAARPIVPALPRRSTLLARATLSLCGNSIASAAR